MQSILVTPRNSQEFLLLSEFLEKSKISNEILSLEEMEDIGLYKLMNESDRSKKVSQDVIFKLLD